MIKNLNKFVCTLTLLGTVASARSQSVLSITGTGSGTLNSVPFSSQTFDWELTFSTANPNLNYGVTIPIYSLLTSQITLQGNDTPINVTQSEGLFAVLNIPGRIDLGPIRMSGATVVSDILSMSGTTQWDGLSSFTATTFSGNFGQFTSIATDQGSLTMNTGSLSSLVIVSAVPEPSTTVLCAMGGVGLLVALRRGHKCNP